MLAHSLRWTLGFLATLVASSTAHALSVTDASDTVLFSETYESQALNSPLNNILVDPGPGSWGQQFSSGGNARVRDGSIGGDPLPFLGDHALEITRGSACCAELRGNLISVQTTGVLTSTFAIRPSGPWYAHASTTPSSPSENPIFSSCCSSS